jgi:hypothetical protein
MQIDMTTNTEEISVKKEHIVIVILLVLLVVIGGAWILSSQLQPKGKEWVRVGIWNGSQTEYNMTTEQFVTTGDEWRISWGCDKVVAASHFDIVVYDVYTSNVVKEIETPFETFSGENYLNAKGRFYLQIFIRGDLGDWQVYVQEYR